MFGKLFIIFVGLLIGVGVGFFIFSYKIDIFERQKAVISPISSSPTLATSSQIIGFLPYWLIDTADKDYTQYITTLSYFSLNVDADGSIQKFTNPGETEPGWYSLQSGKADSFLKTATEKHLTKSLVVFSGNEEHIRELIKDPVSSAQNLVHDIGPVMKKYGFVDLNLDIESVITASDEARMQFTSFVKELKTKLNQQKLGTLTVDVAPIALIRDYLINVKEIAAIADYIVLMTYDYHYSGSLVTGPVAPLSGAGVDSEYDTETAVKEALRIMPGNKIILGLPLYGYEWETLADSPRSAVIPDTGLVASAKRVEKIHATCGDCTSGTDAMAKEPYLTYLDTDTNTYHQIFYPDTEAVTQKIELVKKYAIGGTALWALGYESSALLDPLAIYKKEITIKSSLF